MLFRMGFFVEGKHLEKVLVAIQGLAINMDVPQPVVNATVVGGKMKQLTGGSMSELVAVEVKKFHKGTKITSSAIKELVERVGGSATSYSHFISQLIDAKVLKKSTKQGEYVVLQGKE